MRYVIRATYPHSTPGPHDPILGRSRSLRRALGRALARRPSVRTDCDVYVAQGGHVLVAGIGTGTREQSGDSRLWSWDSLCGSIDAQVGQTMYIPVWHADDPTEPCGWAVQITAPDARSGDVGKAVWLPDPW